MNRLTQIVRGIALTAAALLAAPALAQPVAPDADPALWVVRDDDTTIYLFGTVHALPSGITWFDDGVRSAFDASDELVMELVDPSPPDIFDMLETYAVASDGRTMSQRLDPDQRARYAREMRRVGLPASRLEELEPWFVTGVLEGAQEGCTCRQGRPLRRALGVETILTSAARHRNMAISALENADMQMGIFAHLSMPAQVAMLMRAVDGDVEGGMTMDDLLGAWISGNDQRLGELDAASFAGSPELMENMLTTRNQRWAQWIALRLDEPGGKFFVAVGAAHLAGPESVQRYLSELGITVERVRY
jgi:uncharacterized protein